MPIKKDTSLSEVKNYSTNLMLEGFDLYTSPILYLGTLPLTAYYSFTLLPIHIGVVATLHLLRKY